MRTVDVFALIDTTGADDNTVSGFSRLGVAMFEYPHATYATAP